MTFVRSIGRKTGLSDRYTEAQKCQKTNIFLNLKIKLIVNVTLLATLIFIFFVNKTFLLLQTAN